MIYPSVVNLADWLAGDKPLAVFTFEDGGLLEASLIPAAARKELARRAHGEGFKSHVGECLSVFISEDGRERRYLLVGLGKKKDLSEEALRRACGSLFQSAKRRCAELAVTFSISTCNIPV